MLSGFELYPRWVPLNVSGFRYSKQIEFQEELINFLKT